MVPVRPSNCIFFSSQGTNLKKAILIRGPGRTDDQRLDIADISLLACNGQGCEPLALTSLMIFGSVLSSRHVHRSVLCWSWRISCKHPARIPALALLP